jgi:N-acyl-D-aspartate/D-glutamate deacylase
MAKDIAAAEGIDVTEVIRKILTAPKGDRTICIQFIIDEQDVETNLAHADMMVGSDGIPDLRGKPHPRLFGTFPRVLGHYVRERGVLTLPEAVRRMTSLPARVFGMENRGRIAPGYWADLLLFDAGHIIDRATYDAPQTEPDGVRAVIVNGQLAYEQPLAGAPGVHTGVGSGRMLRYRRSAFGEAEV